MEKKRVTYAGRAISGTMSEIMKKQIEDLRKRLVEYQVVHMRNNGRLNYDVLPNHADILLFGPAGSGKSSLIRTFYRALNGVRQLPNQVNDSLIIKKKNQNEGTT